MPVDVIQLLKEAGLASEDVHLTDNDNDRYDNNFLSPKNLNGKLLPIFHIKSFLRMDKEIHLQRVHHIARPCNDYLGPYNYYLVQLSRYDKILDRILVNARFYTTLAAHLEIDGPVNYSLKGFSKLAHELINHFDKTRFAYCAYKRACYYADEETIAVLTDIRQIAIDIALHRSIGELHLLNISKYNEKLATLETTIKSLEKTARSNAHYGRLWSALHFFLATIKKIIPTDFLKAKCENANQEANKYDALKYTSTHTAQSVRLFQEKIGVKEIKAEIDTLLRNKNKA